jgi:uncharacterized protein
MGKLLLLAVAVWLIIVILKRYRNSLKQSSPSSRAEDMVQCAVCGLHLPKNDSLFEDSKYYCSSAHLEQQNHDR